MTTPPCSEAVMWTVFETPLTINMETRELIIKTAETRAANNNYRVPMPMNGRQVTFYHNKAPVTCHDDKSAAGTNSASIFFATCAALALN